MADCSNTVPADAALMRRLAARFSALARDARGSTALEYALVTLLIGLALISGIAAFGTAVNKLYSKPTAAVATL